MDIPLTSDALDISFHPDPNTHLLATGLISGKLQLISYDGLADHLTNNKNKSKEEEEEEEEQKPTQKLYQKLWTTRPTPKSCRGLSFDHDGSSILSISKDKSIFTIDTETGKQKVHWVFAHDAAPSRLVAIEPNLFATGDDDGVVKLWDPRKPTSSGSVRSYEHHFDWITDMLWCPHLEPPRRQDKLKEKPSEIKRQKKARRKKRKLDHDDDNSDSEQGDQDQDDSVPKTGRSRLVCTSGDGTLSVIDIRMGGKNAVEVSEDQEDELLSISAVKSGKKLVVGTQLGMLSLWAPSKGLLDHVDRIPGHPASVDTMVTLDQDTVLTGSSDGLVRVIQILPHKLLGVIAEHGKMPVERIKRKDRFVASIGHGNEVKFTDVAALLEDDDQEEEDDEEEEGKQQSIGIVEFKQQGQDDSEQEEDSEEEEEQDPSTQKDQQDDDSNSDPDSDSEEDDDKKRILARQKKVKKLYPAVVVNNDDDQQSSNFFSDL